MFNAGDVIQSRDAPYDLFLVIGFVKNVMAVARLGQSATYPQLKDIDNALASDLDISYNDLANFGKVTSIERMNRNLVFSITA